MPSPAAPFVFMTCRPGAEGALKREVAGRQPEWRLAFSRPGYLTFKYGGEGQLDPRALAETRWTFAHAHGVSLGRIQGSQLNDLVQQVWQRVAEADWAAPADEFVDVHVWQHMVSNTDAGSDGDTAMLPYMTPLTVEVETAVRAAAPEVCAKLKRIRRKSAKSTSRARLPSPRDGLVLDVCLFSPGEWWIGCHRATTIVERYPGGFTATAVPPHAVSRAYAKLDEAIRWSGLPVVAGDECVEIGCAPGGASQALLDRGLFVTGIDPAQVDPAVLAHPRFRHLKKRGADVRKHEFQGVRWLVIDMNIAPTATLAEVEPIVTHPGLTIRGLVLTLKLPDWGAAEQLDEHVARVRGWGYRDVRVRQLTTGGQELCLVALRRKALRRLGKKRGDESQPTRKRPHRRAGQRDRRIAKGGRNVGETGAPRVSDTEAHPANSGTSPAARFVESAHTPVSGPHF